MKNYVQEGDTLTLTAPYARSAGEGAKIGSIFGIACNDVANAAEGEWAVTGVYDLAKVAAQAWTAGDRIYWDDGGKLCSNVSTVGQFVGIAVKDAANPSATGRVALCCCAELNEGAQAAITDADETNTGVPVNQGDATPVATVAEVDAIAAKLNLALAALRATGIIAAA